MNYRTLGKTGFNISEVSLGTWQLGGKWGAPFDIEDADATLAEAYEQGVNFFDTADGYQGGDSEKAVGAFLKTHPDVHFTTKIGRKEEPLSVDHFAPGNLTRYVEDSLTNMGVESLDMVLLHCPPMSIYYTPETFFEMDKLKQAGKIQNYGVSVERVEEGIKALDYDISAVEIIFNMFRLRPAKLFFDLAKQHNVGVLARVPLASGLLTGKYTADTKFGKEDHRTTNRNGELFDKGETFSGVDYLTGVKAADTLKQRLGTNNLAATALRYILMYDAVSAVIPGASSPQQIERNTAASALPPLTAEQMQIVSDVYDQYIKNPVDYLW
ncbi:oxidoreductase, aldo keto reductase family protein [Secundilactobacillus odoratitofui DSM 19909 = JCM 15043]|uniref:Oxidoreductase, aldo keto reductase family protein n=1 Tax=Secundilactobacillus odoratitofui DSM 19909 = JCM 15043 TaxID=1423776 RepID=A0A0R1M3N2_9LACO|nr:aldo/keto reductase [Secundilactobacillus odoratitofui]KRK98487.1 oxidoreductase, aldo keto reductase family protein [Secundilactobacillus odoratitofui DSM 19909 = JCM 15043]